MHFADDEIDIVKQLVEKKLTNGRRFVVERLQRNVEGDIPVVDDDALWYAHIMCLLTTQQRSGPGSAVNKFLDLQPFPLSLDACRAYANLENRTQELLTEIGGIRRTNRIAKAVMNNFPMLQEGEWDNLRNWRDKLLDQRRKQPDLSHRDIEERASNYMRTQFLEFGPKQSRNYWQHLGLTRYVFVLDSRMLKWLEANLKSKADILQRCNLSNVKSYSSVSDMLFELCKSADVLPCMFDAAVFDSFDEGTEWSDGVIW